MVTEQLQSLDKVLNALGTLLHLKAAINSNIYLGRFFINFLMKSIKYKKNLGKMKEIL